MVDNAPVHLYLCVVVIVTYPPLIESGTVPAETSTGKRRADILSTEVVLIYLAGDRDPGLSQGCTPNSKVIFKGSRNS
jgi:hypothetical protein